VVGMDSNLSLDAPETQLIYSDKKGLSTDLFLKDERKHACWGT
jgi:hypothetical protein